MLGVVRSGWASVLLHRARSLAIVGCIVALLLPFTAGTALSLGLADGAARAARFGADLVVTGVRYGMPAPLPASVGERIRAVPGVTAVRARIVGSVVLGKSREPAVVVGIEGDAPPAEARLVEGEWFRPGGADDLVVGAVLARRLGMEPGTRLPPFYSNRDGEHASVVKGVFRSDLPPWEAHLVLTSLETARRIFDERETVTQYLVDCEDGYGEPVRAALERIRDGPESAGADAPPLALRVLDRAALEATLAEPLSFGGGVFALHFMLLFAAAVPLLVVATGAGLRERRREVGVLKMLGWGTDAVLLRAFTESLVLALAGASLAILGAALWLGPLGARGIAAVFLPGVEAEPGFAVPWRMAPGPVAAATALALTLVLVGTLASNARAAATEPVEAMR